MQARIEGAAGIASKVTLLEEIYAAPSFERQIEIMGQYVEFFEEGE